MRKYCLFSMVLMILLILPTGIYAADTGTYNEGITTGIERGRVLSFPMSFNEVVTILITRVSSNDNIISQDYDPTPYIEISVPDTATYNESVSVEVEKAIQNSIVIYLIIIIISMMFFAFILRKG